MTCYPCFLGKRRKFLLQQIGIRLAKFFQVGKRRSRARIFQQSSSLAILRRDWFSPAPPLLPRTVWNFHCPFLRRLLPRSRPFPSGVFVVASTILSRPSSTGRVPSIPAPFVSARAVLAPALRWVPLDGGGDVLTKQKWLRSIHPILEFLAPSFLCSFPGREFFGRRLWGGCPPGAVLASFVVWGWEYLSSCLFLVSLWWFFSLCFWKGEENHFLDLWCCYYCLLTFSTDDFLCFCRFWSTALSIPEGENMSIRLPCFFVSTLALFTSKKFCKIWIVALCLYLTNIVQLWTN